jgi:Flp pilus assembly protein TadG
MTSPADRSICRRFDAAASGRERGAIAVYVAVVLLLIIGFAGLALDTALVKLTTRQLQDAADAAALAAVQEAWVDDAGTNFARTRQAAMDIAAANQAAQDPVQLEANVANATAGDIVVGTWDRDSRAFTATTSTRPDAVKVTARRTSASPGGSLALLFGGIFGTAASDVSRTAVAHLRSASSPAAVLILHPTRARAFELRGTPYLSAPGGLIQVNSSHNREAVYLNGAPDDPRVVAQRVNVVGSSAYPRGTIVPAPIDGSDPLPDPLAGLPYPDTAAMANRGGITGAGDYLPGYYPDGVDFNSGNAVLSPGVYVFGAHGIALNGSALITGNEVMIFLALGARVTTSGTDSGLDYSAPTSGVYEGVALFAHRDSALDFVIGGTGVFDIRGAMYMARGHLEMHGTVDRRIGRIIVYTQLLRGTGRYTITGEGPPGGDPLYPYLVR